MFLFYFIPVSFTLRSIPASCMCFPAILLDMIAAIDTHCMLFSVRPLVSFLFNSPIIPQHVIYPLGISFIHWQAGECLRSSLAVKAIGFNAMKSSDNSTEGENGFNTNVVPYPAAILIDYNV